MRDGEVWIRARDAWEGDGTWERAVNSGGSMYRVAVTHHCGWACMSQGWGCVGHSLVVETTKVDIPRGVTLGDAKHDLVWDGAGLAPSKLEFLAMKGELFDSGMGRG